MYANGKQIGTFPIDCLIDMCQVAEHGKIVEGCGKGSLERGKILPKEVIFVLGCLVTQPVIANLVLLCSKKLASLALMRAYY